MSSKKKRRREKWLKREAKRNKEKNKQENIKNASTIKETADAMGIKLK